MFYDRFKELCDRKGVSCYRAARDMGLSNATASKWKKTGATPDSSTLAKICDYFNVSMDYLVGTEIGKTIIPNDERLDEQLSGIDFALSGEVHDLTDAEKQDLLEYIKFKKSQRGIAK